MRSWDKYCEDTEKAFKHFIDCFWQPVYITGYLGTKHSYLFQVNYRQHKTTNSLISTTNSLISTTLRQALLLSRVQNPKRLGYPVSYLFNKSKSIDNA